MTRGARRSSSVSSSHNLGGYQGADLGGLNQQLLTISCEDCGEFTTMYAAIML